MRSSELAASSLRASPQAVLWQEIPLNLCARSTKPRSLQMNIPDSIPFLDLVAPHRELEAELMAVFQTAIRTAGFIGGPMVEDFERAFATFCACKHSVAVSSGTDAL